ncbi:uncharacterized protein LOC118184783, partial [Stegodyphus dumicola]|uniref:uncharacterized protein LOC118184783 n=1 Tax=Stegodyphus dumicola TaxID=202533 RepID=UPI0015A99AE3
MNKDLKLWSGMSEIERLALKNREEHLALLRSLKIDQVKEDVIRVVEELKPKKKPKPVKRVYKNIPSSRPWMKKNRMLQKLGIDFLLRKSRRLEELNTDLSLRKSRRIEKLNVNLSECVRDAKAIAKAEKKAEENIKKKDFIWTSKEISTYECDLSSNADNRYVSRFPFMKIDEVAKVVPSRITAMALNPLPDRIIVTAADVSGNMSFWKV